MTTKLDPLTTRRIEKFREKFTSSGFLKSEYLLRDGGKLLIEDYEQFLIDTVRETKEEMKSHLEFDLYSLDWIKILDKAIKNRPNSWNKDPIYEWRNASDEVLAAVINALIDKGLLFSLKEKLVLRVGETPFIDSLEQKGREE